MLLTPFLRRPLVLVTALLLAGCAAWQTPTVPVSVRILAINDFHGSVKPSREGINVTDPSDQGKKVQVAAGGSELLASAVKQLREGQRHSIFVAAGDLVGASPLLSALFHDEPTIRSLSLMGLELSAVGNHEFDNGLDELLRKQNGGCHPKDGCKGPEPFKGAGYKYLAASTIDLKTGKTVLPPYEIRHFDGIPVAFIGMALRGTPELISPAAAEGLRFEDEVETVHKLLPELRAQGVEAFVLLIHEGGYPTGGPNECPSLSGAIVGLVKKLDPAVGLVVSGHTHRSYVCRFDGRLVTSAERYGVIVSAIDLKLDRKTRRIVSAEAHNEVTDPARYAKAPEQTALLAAYETQSAALINRVVARIAETIEQPADRTGSSPMGQLIADAYLDATAAPQNGGAQLALVNQTGVRRSLTFRGDGSITFGDIYAAQPFKNELVTLSLTGEELRLVLEQQWRPPSQRNSPLPVSKGFSYSFDGTRPLGQRVLVETMRLNGKPIDLKAVYRVTTNDYLSTGGDGYTSFAAGKSAQIGKSDLDALVEYLEKLGAPVRSPAMDRVKRID
ncbi:bifunctional metallophosphatase/5'-nucleotidase [Pelomonas sp. SE-A7]|uniref:bifunctional metallophosphatase/5'-nucleotidase n=1 Tax=Pelomonas sp. SE-A7 TaxID=3054953 RepID=UPI00259D17DF|nr:bifunctional metallophosphatase/5'-nucleotidase [Pelomonas sp. SE-A7]MDM4765369.1 bifunctional metallophosphatase/5'-nucleotidase [Pelomonas sp. SE-A7]